MAHSYLQGAYIAAPYAFESAKNSESEQIRSLAGLPTYYRFTAGVFDANDIYEWLIPADIVVESFWVQYPGSPGGTMTLTLYNEVGAEQSSLILNTNNNGEKFDNAWAYNFKAPFPIPKDWAARFKPSVAISSVVAYGEPCLFFEAMPGVRIS